MLVKYNQSGLETPPVRNPNRHRIRVWYPAGLETSPTGLLR